LEESNVELFSDVKDAAEYVALLGAGFMAVWYGAKRVYNLAKSVEKILTHVVDDKKERDVINESLQSHIKMEEDRDEIRDSQLIEITQDLREITREIRPNGGSSMKDTLNAIAKDMGDMNARLARVEQWKKDHEG
jgi:hypothetical protein